MRLRFWPLLIGVLVIIWGTTALARGVLGISFPPIYNTYLWSTVAVIVGFWFIARATREARLC